MLLKVVLLPYSRGIVSNRRIEQACWDHVTFVPLSGDACPHFTTIAGFVSGFGDLIADVFKQVLLVCDRQGLIGREMFAIDGIKLPSNASKQKSGTRAVEPVFANLRYNKKLARFTLRGRIKVDAQWKLFCLVHNIEKLAHHGYGQCRQGRHGDEPDRATEPALIASAIDILENEKR